MRRANVLVITYLLEVDKETTKKRLNCYMHLRNRTVFLILLVRISYGFLYNIFVSKSHSAGHCEFNQMNLSKVFLSLSSLLHLLSYYVKRKTNFFKKKNRMLW